MRENLIHEPRTLVRRLLGDLAPVVVLVVGLLWFIGQRSSLPAWALLLACIAAGSLVSIACMVVRELHGARRRRSHYLSGDRGRVQVAVRQELATGTSSLHLRALALAGVGDFAAARRALLRSDHCELEDQELRLCAHIVILAFEGQLSCALGLCRRLVAVPVAGMTVQRLRRNVRREGIVALTRVISGTADEADFLALHQVAILEPSLYWACRYGAAVACCMKEEPQLAWRLVRHAPHWPKESVFRLIHSRILIAGRTRPVPLLAV